MRGNGIATEYSRQLRRKFRMWPTWLPDGDVRVGDFGRVDRGLFVRQGRLDGPPATIAPKGARTGSDHLFASDGVRHAIIGAAGVTPDGKAGVRIELGRKFGIFVALRDCREKRVSDPLAAATELGGLRERGRWPDDYCLVTSVVHARAGLIVMGSKAGGVLELSASSPVSDILTGLESEMRVSSETSVSYRGLMTSGCTPLFRLSRLGGHGEFVFRGPGTPSLRLLELDPLAVP